MFAALALIASVIVLCVGYALVPEVRSRGAVSMLSSVKGDVVVWHASGALVRAREGDLLETGDAIRTGSGANAELTYVDGSSVCVDSDAQLVIESFANESDRVTAMWQMATRAWHAVTELVGGGSRYQIRTPSSTASVRG